MGPRRYPGNVSAVAQFGNSIGMCLRVFRLALICAGLAACAPTVEADLTHATEVHGTACAVLKIAELPLAIEHGQLIVDAGINGTPVRLIVDTGADSLVLSAAAVDRLHLPQGRGKTRSFGIGGVTESDNAFVGSFEFGGFRLRDKSVAVSAFKPPVDGLLGATFLAAFDVEIDPAGHRLTLWGSRHCADGFLPWSPPFDAIALNDLRADRISLPIQVGDQTLTMLLDTGAVTTTMVDAAAARLGVTDAALAADRSFEQIGADSHPVRARMHHFANARIGAEALDDVAIAVAPLELARGIDGLLGANYLRGRRIWIDYSNRRLYVQSARVPLPPG